MQEHLQESAVMEIFTMDSQIDSVARIAWLAHRERKAGGRASRSPVAAEEKTPQKKVEKRDQGKKSAPSPRKEKPAPPQQQEPEQKEVRQETKKETAREPESKERKAATATSASAAAAAAAVSDERKASLKQYLGTAVNLFDRTKRIKMKDAHLVALLTADMCVQCLWYLNSVPRNFASAQELVDAVVDLTRSGFIQQHLARKEKLTRFLMRCMLFNKTAQKISFEDADIERMLRVPGALKTLEQFEMLGEKYYKVEDFFAALEQSNRPDRKVRRELMVVLARGAIFQPGGTQVIDEGHLTKLLAFGATVIPALEEMEKVKKYKNIDEVIKEVPGYLQ